MATGFDFSALYKAQDAEQPQPKAPGLMGHIADTGLQLAQGVLSGGEMLANTFGADNAVSQRLRKGSEWLASNFSDQLKWEQLTTARETEAAALSGSTWEEIKAASKGFGRDPVGFLVNAAGTTLPSIAAAFLPGGQSALLGRLSAMAIGGAQGAGAVKGQIFGEVEKAWKEAGATDEEAKTRATAAQEYLGSNAGQIAIGTALGVAAGGTGLEGAIAAKKAGSAFAPGAGLMGKVPRFVAEGVKEAVPEALQGGQEQLAGNIAVQNEGFARDTWSGVAGGATLEGLAGGLMGSAASPFTRPKAPAPKSDEPPEAPAMRELAAAKTSGDAVAAAMAALEAPIAPAPEKFPSFASQKEASIYAGQEGLGELQPVLKGGAWTVERTTKQPAPEVATDPNALEFDADPFMKGRVAFDNGAAPGAPVFKSKQAADIYIGEQGGMGELAAVAVGPDRWVVQQAPEAADKQAEANIEQWMQKTTPRSEEVIREAVSRAATELNKQLVPLPMPDGKGWTAVPAQWVTPAVVANYTEQARAALAVEQDGAARRAQIEAEPVQRAPRTRLSDGVEIAPADPVDSFIADQRQLNTPAARAYVQDFEAGRITRDDVLQRVQREAPRSDAEVANQRLAAAAQEAPKPGDGLLLTAEGFPYGTRSGAVVRARREGLNPESVIEVAGGYAVRPKESPRVEPELPSTAEQLSRTGVAQPGDAERRPGSVGLVPADTQRAVSADPGQAQAGGRAAVSAGLAGEPDVALSDAAVTPEAQAARGEAPAPAEAAAAPEADVPGARAGAVEADGVKRSDAADDYLQQLFGASESEVAADPFAVLEREAAKGAANAKEDGRRIRAAIDAEKKRALAEHDDWSGRTYKANRTQVDLRGDGPSSQASMSIGAINEGRRRGAMEALSQEIQALGKFEQGIANDADAAKFIDAMRALYARAEKIAADGNGLFKTPGEQFQYMLLDELQFRGPGGKGNVTSNGLSRAVLAAIKPGAANQAPSKQDNAAAQPAPKGEDAARPASPSGGTADSQSQPVGQPAPQPKSKSLKERAEAMKPSREVIDLKKRLAVLNKLKECLNG